jgi:hypothetical protein
LIAMTPLPHRHAWILAATLCAGLLAPSGVQARRLSGTLVGQTKHFIGSDRGRFVAWRSLSGPSTLVLDTGRHRVVSVADVAGCAAPNAIGAGALVYGCPGGQPGLLAAGWLKDLRTGVARQVVRSAPGAVDSRQWIGVGRRWLQAQDQGYHVTVSAFYDRATGAQYAGRSPFGARRQPDLDRAGLVRAICSPLRVPVDQADASETTDGYASLLLDGRFALNAGPTFASTPSGSPLVLERCGTSRHQVLCRSLCRTPTFSRGKVVWADGLELHTYRLADHRQKTYSFAAGSAMGVWPVGDRLLVAIDDNTVAQQTGQLSLRLVRLP